MNPGARSGVRLPNGTKENDDHYYKMMVIVCRGLGIGTLEESIEYAERHYTYWSPVPPDEAKKREIRDRITSEWKAALRHAWRAAEF